MQLVGAGLRSARQDEPNHQKFSANSYARTHLTVGGDAYIDPAECTISTKIFGEFVTSQRADVGHRPLQTWWDVHMDSPKIFAEQLCALPGLLLLQPLQKNLRQPDQNQESAE